MDICQDTAKKIVQHAKKKWIANTSTKLENMNINAVMHADIYLTCSNLNVLAKFRLTFPWKLILLLPESKVDCFFYFISLVSLLLFELTCGECKQFHIHKLAQLRRQKHWKNVFWSIDKTNISCCSAFDLFIFIVHCSVNKMKEFTWIERIGFLTLDFVELSLEIIYRYQDF